MPSAPRAPAPVAAKTPSKPAPPLFYKSPIALTAALHSGMSYAPPGTFAFARHSNSLPLTIAEFAAAGRHYPIVFSAARPTVPVAIVGIGSDDNLFVDDGGRWLEGAYVPAYVRRYPFIILQASGAGELILGIDEAANALVQGGDNPLFADGRPTPLVERALAFCADYQGAANATRQFCDALEAESLLVDREADLELKDGRKGRLTGLRIVDAARFDKLGTKTFLKFRRLGFLQPIYLHLAAAANWATVIDLAAKRRA